MNLSISADEISFLGSDCHRTQD